MPRSAATMLGLVLVAFSIGFNTARYPVVWEMVSPAKTCETVQATAALQPENPEYPPPSAARPFEWNPTSETTDAIVADNTLPVPADAKPDQGRDAALAHPESPKPLVPVAHVGGSGRLGGEGVRRLPPVAQTEPLATSRAAAVSYSGSIPVYPSTGIE